MAGASKDSKTLDLTEIRKHINDIDERLQALINERATIAQQVGVAKGDLGSAVDYYRPEREAEVLRSVLERNKGPMRDDEMLRLFREIMSACLAQQEPLKIGFLGPEGTFTQTAVFKHFGHSVRALPTRCFRRSNVARPILVSCRSKTRPKARSTTHWTCSSLRRSKLRARLS